MTKRFMAIFNEGIVASSKRHWKAVLSIIGISGVGDLLKEYFRAKAMDWLMTRLGLLGIFLATYRLATVTIGLIVVIGWLVIDTKRRPTILGDSAIVDPSGRPYQLNPGKKRSPNWFVAASLASVLFLMYGGFIFFHTVPLLSRYPLGYVTFECDYVTGAVTPLETRRGLESFQFDFKNVDIIQNSNDRIVLQFPDIWHDGTLIAHDAITAGPKRVGELGGAMARDKNGGIMELAEILNISGSRVTFLVGFQRLS